jgi:KUP system potassium uptake protein
MTAEQPSEQPNGQENPADGSPSETGTKHGGGLAALSLGAVGVVYGDIGTSPLYTIHESLAFGGGKPVPVAILGVLSLIFWSLILVVSLKYVIFVMRADNKGEGGVMALMALAKRSVDDSVRARWILAIIGILGAGLFYGDSVITPAISVLGAVEGLEVAAPEFSHLVVEIALVIVIGMFALQKFGTHFVGKAFAPIMLVWFLALAALGIYQLYLEPHALLAINPLYGLRFLADHGMESFIALGGVVLALTGAEALYADMGHFGKMPIRLAWFCLVLPSLLLNYFGQGALLLRKPETISNPFYHMAPDIWLYPMILLATLAAIIASQAVISGAYSMTRQAMSLGYAPRFKVVHTSSEMSGQIYLPLTNWILFVLVVCAILAFQSSANLGAAYGIAVTGTMTMTTLLVLVVARRRWHWRWSVIVPIACLQLTIDLSFLGANLLKVASGGWFPLTLGLAVFIVMSTWRRGRELVARILRNNELPLDSFVENIMAFPPTRVKGTAVFLTSNVDSVSHALLHNLKHNKVLHERNIMLSVDTLETPFATDEDHIKVIDKGSGFYGVELRFGFAEEVDVPKALMKCARLGLVFDMQDTTFFLSRETVMSADKRLGMSFWRYKLFSFMARNAEPATASFKIPGNRMVELGTEMYF